MTQPLNLSRRALLKRLALGAAAAPLAASPRHALSAPASPPLLSATAPEAQAVKYVEDAKRAPEAKGNTCATCALYQGSYGSAQGPCQIFPGKAVKAGGWCASWSAQM